MHLQGWVMGWCPPGRDGPREAGRPGRSCTALIHARLRAATSSPAGPPRPGTPRAMHQARAGRPAGAVRGRTAPGQPGRPGARPRVRTQRRTGPTRASGPLAARAAGGVLAAWT